MPIPSKNKPVVTRPKDAAAVIPVQENDYIIVIVQEKQLPDGSVRTRKGLLCVTSVTGDTCTGILEYKRPHQNVETSVNRDKVVANLGPTPLPGSVHGCYIAPYLRSIKHKYWGKVHVYYNLSPETVQALGRAFNRTAAWLTQQKLSGLLPIETKIQPPKGAVAGHWTPSRNEDTPPTMTLMLAPLDYSKTEVVDALMFHEYAHGMWNSWFTDEVRAAWIREYHRLVEISRIPKQELMESLQAFEKSEQTIKGYTRSLEDEREALVFGACINQIVMLHCLHTRHLELLVAVGDGLADKWPQTLATSILGETITDYALKSPEELWADAFKLHATGVKLPKTLLSLMQKSLSVCKGQ